MRRAGEVTGRQPAVGQRWMVSTPSAMATLIAARILDDGGNAVDAALAASAALMVAVPHQTSPGGDAFWLLKRPSEPPIGLNASGKSGADADAALLRAMGLPRVPPRGGAAVTTPGVIDGWHAASSRFGSRSLSELVEPAAAAAREGLAATPYLVRQLEAADGLLAGRPESSRIYRPQGRAVRVGEYLALPELGASIERAASDVGSFMGGAPGRAIVDAVQDEGGFLIAADVAGHQSDWVEPTSGPLPSATGPDGWVLHELGPNSQGWLALFASRLAARLQDGRGYRIALRAAIEAAKAATVLRAAVLADPRSMPAPAGTFLENGYLDRAARSLAALGGATPAQVSRALEVPLTLDLPTTGDTVHFAIVDADGFAVSCIQSLYFDFGTGIVPRGAGFALQNRGAGFTLREGHPNMLAPGKRPLHTLAPAMATDATGNLTAVLGAMGGDAQTQIHAQLLLALRSDLDPARATSLPRWFVRPRRETFELLIEGRGRSLSGLEGNGHVITKVAPFDELMGHAQVVVRLSDGTLLGAADPRSDGLALGR